MDCKKIAEEFGVEFDEEENCFCEINLPIIGTALVDRIGTDIIKDIEYIPPEEDHDEPEWIIYLKKVI